MTRAFWHGSRPSERIAPWTQRRLAWIAQEVQVEPPAQEARFLDCFHEVEHVAPPLEQRVA